MFLVNLLKSRLGERERMTSQTARITSPKRHHLAHQIETTITPRTDDRIINNLDETISSTKIAIDKMVRSELFLDLRIRKYRMDLDQQSARLSSRHLTEGYDAEKEQDVKEKLHQQELYDQKLREVVDLQKNILAEIETMRRKLRDLEKKRDEMSGMISQCEDFLLASASIDLQRASDEHMILASNGDGNGNDSGDDNLNNSGDAFIERDIAQLEMGVLNRRQRAIPLDSTRRMQEVAYPSAPPHTIREKDYDAGDDDDSSMQELS